MRGRVCVCVTFLGSRIPYDVVASREAQRELDLNGREGWLSWENDEMRRRKMKRALLLNMAL